jgi:hypothetical protein
MGEAVPERRTVGKGRHWKEMLRDHQAGERTLIVVAGLAVGCRYWP